MSCFYLNLGLWTMLQYRFTAPTSSLNEKKDVVLFVDCPMLPLIPPLLGHLHDNCLPLLWGQGKCSGRTISVKEHISCNVDPLKESLFFKRNFPLGKYLWKSLLIFLCIMFPCNRSPKSRSIHIVKTPYVRLPILLSFF